MGMFDTIIVDKDFFHQRTGILLSEAPSFQTKGLCDELMTFEVKKDGTLEPIPDYFGYEDWHYRKWTIEEVRERIRNFTEEYISIEHNSSQVCFHFEVKDWQVVKLEIIEVEPTKEPSASNPPILNFKDISLLQDEAQDFVTSAHLKKPHIPSPVLFSKDDYDMMLCRFDALIAQGRLLSEAGVSALIEMDERHFLDIIRSTLVRLKESGEPVIQHCMRIMSFGAFDREAALRIFLHIGGNPNLFHTEDRPPLFNAMLFFDSEGPLVALLAAGADPHIRDQSGRNALHALVGDSDSFRDPRRLKFFLRKLDLLIKAGVDIDALDHLGESPLFVAASRMLGAEFPEAFVAYVHAGADRRTLNRKRHSPAARRFLDFVEARWPAKRGCGATGWRYKIADLISPGPRVGWLVPQAVAAMSISDSKMLNSVISEQNFGVIVARVIRRDSAWWTLKLKVHPYMTLPALQNPWLPADIRSLIAASSCAGWERV